MVYAISVAAVDACRLQSDKQTKCRNHDNWRSSYITRYLCGLYDYTVSKNFRDEFIAGTHADVDFQIS
jgi:hypothetical protein